MWSKLFPDRFALLKIFIVLFLSLSFLVRLSFFIWDFAEVDIGVIDILVTFLTGFFFDLGTISLFIILDLVYLVAFPSKWFGSLIDKIITWVGFFLAVLILFFSFFGEFTFWDEFQRRYNFIAVDYLIYTYEVVQNINESYPLPILLSSLIALIAMTLFIIYKNGFFRTKFQSETKLKNRARAAMPWMVIAVVFSLFITNNQAEWSENRYNNELSKAGIYSFFAAFRNNELSFKEFYQCIDEKEAFSIVNDANCRDVVSYVFPSENSIMRVIKNSDSIVKPGKPNVIFICIESLSGKYLNALGGNLSITPVLDSLASESTFFTNLFATGTRTVRAMEAITLSIPPTPGRSIVKRKNNMGLFTIGEVFRQKGYERNFFYGGDGYFDNMNSYFGGNGFNIVDRGRGLLLEKGIVTTRTNI